MENSPKNKKPGKIWKVILIIFCALALTCLIAVFADAPGRKEIQQLALSGGFGELKDGTYIGEYIGTKSYVRDTRLEVQISGGEISDVKIVKGAIDKEGKPIIIRNGKSVQDIFNEVKSKRTLQVDVISGATITSKAHLKALENALEQAMVKQTDN